MRLEAPIDALDIPAGMVFTPPTRSADSWHPRHEFKLQTPWRQHASRIVIDVTPGVTWKCRVVSRRRRMTRWFKRRPLDLSGRLVFDARYEADGNVAHQISMINAVLMAREELAKEGRAEITVLLGSNAPAYSRSLYAEVGVPMIATDVPVIADVVEFETVSALAQPAWKGEGALKWGGLSLAFSRRHLPHLEVASPPSGDMPERLFIARRGARSLINQEEVSRFLASRGYQETYFEDLTVGNQIQLARHARSIVALHGAALCYMVFNHNGLARAPGDLGGLKVVELFGAGYQVDMYRRMAAVLNAHWCAVVGPMSSSIFRDLNERQLARAHQSTPFSIDLNALEIAIEYSDRATDLTHEAALAKTLFGG